MSDARTDPRDTDGPLSVGESKLRLREWGLEAQAAHNELIGGVRRFAPWAIGGRGLSLLWKFFVGRRKRGDDGSSSEPAAPARGGIGSAGLWAAVLPVAIRLGPTLLRAYLRASKSRDSAAAQGQQRSV